jgi:hypothetical protein
MWVAFAARSFFLEILRVWDTSNDPRVIPATINGIMIGVVGIEIKPRYTLIQANLYKPNYRQ